MATPKFLYTRTYSVLRIDGGRQSVVLDRYPAKEGAETLAVAATNNVPGRVFKVREHSSRTPNPAYVGV